MTPEEARFAVTLGEGIARDLGRTVTRDELNIICRKLGTVESKDQLMVAWNEAIAEIKANERRN